MGIQAVSALANGVGHPLVLMAACSAWFISMQTSATSKQGGVCSAYQGPFLLCVVLSAVAWMLLNWWGPNAGHLNSWTITCQPSWLLFASLGTAPLSEQLGACSCQ